jgi:hypothetical protein
VLAGLPDEAEGATAAGGGNPDTAEHAPLPEQHVEGEQAAGAEFPAPALAGLPGEAKGATAAGGDNPTVEGAWEIVACWLQPAFLDDEPVARWATDITVAEMVAADEIAVDVVATEIFPKGRTKKTWGTWRVRGDSAGQKWPLIQERPNHFEVQQPFRRFRRL